MKTKLTDEKYLNLFKDENGYCWAERADKARAVSVLPVLKTADGEKILFIREWRPAVGKWIIQLPAGLIDKGETPRRAAIRELKEETGADALSLTEVAGGFTSAGLTNEYAVMFKADVVLNGGQSLQGNEKIKLLPVPREQVKEFVLKNKESFCLRSALLALLYYNERSKQFD